jgi:hypothetical protein
VADTSPPSVPGSFVANLTAPYPSYLYLTWNGSGESDNFTTAANMGYQFCAAAPGVYCNSPSGSYYILAGGNSVQSALYYGGLTSMTTYWMGMRAVDQAGNASAWTYAAGTTAVSYYWDVDQIFNASSPSGQSIASRNNCNGCHGYGLPGPWSYDYFFVSPANDTASLCTPYISYISPGNPAGSRLLQMMASPYNACEVPPTYYQMPYLGESGGGTVGSCSISSGLSCSAGTGTTYIADITTMYNWIAQGALNN